jgi:hypothetical protein
MTTDDHHIPGPSVPSGTPLGAALQALRENPYGPTALARVSAVADEIAGAMTSGRIDYAVAATALLVRLEAGVPDQSSKRSYGIAMRRILTGLAVGRMAPLLLDPLYKDEVAAVLERAGAESTNVLLTLLIEATTIAERRQYFDALRATKEGSFLAIRLLEDERWFVVRNMAELVGDLRLEEAVPVLGKAVQHREVRVRRSVAMALAKIGTAATVEHLRRALKDEDKETRRLVARSIEGRRAAALAMPLVLAAESEQDPELVQEYYLALGRIGTPDAVQALIKALAPGGLFKRKPAGPRIAAIQALRIAGGPAALSALQNLKADSQKGVRDAAVQALAELAT